MEEQRKHVVKPHDFVIEKTTGRRGVILEVHKNIYDVWQKDISREVRLRLDEIEYLRASRFDR